MIYPNFETLLLSLIQLDQIIFGALIKEIQKFITALQYFKPYFSIIYSTIDYILEHLGQSSRIGTNKFHLECILDVGYFGCKYLRQTFQTLIEVLHVINLDQSVDNGVQTLDEVFFYDLVDDTLREGDSLESLTILVELFEIYVVFELDDFIKQFEQT